MVWEGDGRMWKVNGIVWEVRMGEYIFLFYFGLVLPCGILTALDQKNFGVGQELLSLIEWSTRSQKMYFFLV